MPNLHEEESIGALFVLDEVVPHRVRCLQHRSPIICVNPNNRQMIDEVLERNVEKLDGDHLLRLAVESLEKLPSAEEGRSTTEPPIPSTWRSPSIGQTIEAALEYLATNPSDSSVMTAYIAMLIGRLYEKKRWLVLCKFDNKGEITFVPLPAAMALAQMALYSQDKWPGDLKYWRERSLPVM